jgi:cytochrome oxidase assembly protein ShyY1
LWGWGHVVPLFFNETEIVFIKRGVVPKQTTYYIMKNLSKLKHLSEVTKGVIQHIKRLMEAII